MILRAICGLSAMVLMTACISPKPYVDPKFAAVDYQSVSVTPQDVSVATTFTREGKPISRAQKILQTNVEEVLTQAGYTVVEEGGDMAFSISFNNLVEEGAFGKGFGTGLTLGLAGTAVSDLYEVKIIRTDDTGAIEREYGHAIHTSIGNVSEPPVANVAPSANIPDAFASMVEDVVLQFLIDAEAETVEGEAIAFAPFTVRVAG